MDHGAPDYGQSALRDHPVALPPTASHQGGLVWSGMAGPDRHRSLGDDPNIHQLGPVDPMEGEREVSLRQL